MHYPYAAWTSRSNLVHAKTVDLYVPAEAEFVLEGTVYADRSHAEGPFVDLTETYDIVRNEPVFMVKPSPTASMQYGMPCCQVPSSTSC